MTAEEPARIQQRRTAGWRKPDGAVAVGRPSKWGNPYRAVQDDLGHWNLEGPDVRGAHWKNIGRELALEHAVTFFRTALRQGTLAYTPEDVARELAGKTLMCWCPVHDSRGRLAPCHARVLLEAANDPVGFAARSPQHQAPPSG